MKSSILYKSLEKILKKHYGNSKTIAFTVGKTPSKKFSRYGFRNEGVVLFIDKDGKHDNYKDYTVTIKKQYGNTIILTIVKKYSDKSFFIKKLTNLDMLFKLLANGGEKIKEEIDKKLVVDRLTDNKENKKDDKKIILPTIKRYRLNNFYNLSKTSKTNSFHNHLASSVAVGWGTLR